MRAALSILGLVIVFAVVMFMMKKQVQQLAPPMAPAASAAGGNIDTPDAVRQKVQAIVDQAASAGSAGQP